jgi:CubicO group peptidase (beta-lactamase class C family)
MASPGMAVGVVMNGGTYVYQYGMASEITRRPVDGNTLCEIGSVSKTLTATLASYAQDTGKLSLSDMASKYLASLRVVFRLGYWRYSLLILHMSFETHETTIPELLVVTEPSIYRF